MTIQNALTSVPVIANVFSIANKPTNFDTTACNIPICLTMQVPAAIVQEATTSSQPNVGVTMALNGCFYCTNMPANGAWIGGWATVYAAN